MTNEADLIHLRRAIGLAAEARAEGNHPFGSVVIAADGRVIAEARNACRLPTPDPTQHAELRAVRLASTAATPQELAGATLYTSTEPCAMCAGAIYWGGIGRVVYALAESGLYALTGANEENPTLRLPCRDVFARGQRGVAVDGPLLEDEAAVVHTGFWV